MTLSCTSNPCALSLQHHTTGGTVDRYFGDPAAAQVSQCTSPENGCHFVASIAIVMIPTRKGLVLVFYHEISLRAVRSESQPLICPRHAPPRATGPGRGGGSPGTPPPDHEISSRGGDSPGAPSDAAYCDIA